MLSGQNLLLHVNRRRIAPNATFQHLNFTLSKRSILGRGAALSLAGSLIQSRRSGEPRISGPGASRACAYTAADSPTNRDCSSRVRVSYSRSEAVTHCSTLEAGSKFIGRESTMAVVKQSLPRLEPEVWKCLSIAQMELELPQLDPVKSPTAIQHECVASPWK